MSEIVKYSFIIPHHNCPELLKRCVSSIPIRNDIQIIIVDDNSDKDKKPDIQHENAYVYYINKGESIGAGHARNVGLQKAIGKWVLFVDADDFYSENFLKILDEYSESDNDVVYFNFRLDNSEGLRKDEKMNWEIVQERIIQKDTDYVRFRFHVPWDKMISLRFLKERNICFEEVVIGNDIQFSLLTGYFANKYKILEDRLYNYYINDKSLSFGFRNIEKLMCLVEGWYKVNAFNKFINHEEWNINILKAFLYLLYRNKKRSMQIFLRFISKIPHFMNVKKRYVKKVKMIEITKS